MKKLLQIALVLVVAASLTQCKSKGWSDAQKKTFLDPCKKGAATAMGEDKAGAYCDCVLGKIMAKYPNASDMEKLKGDEATEVGKTAGMECLTK